MPLPKIETPKYELIVPSTGKTVKYRPFLVREEKILLLAMESEDENQMVLAIQEIIKNCVYEELDTAIMPMFDIEYIFLQLRAKSKGEIAELTAECEQCNNPIAFQIDLSKIEVTGLKGHNNKIHITNDIGVILDYPSIKLQKSIDGDVTDIKNIFETITNSINSIWDKDSIYPAKDHTTQELDDFIESLSDENFLKIKEFFDTLPSLSHDVELKCKSKKGKKNCGWSQTKTLEGLASFFE